MNKDLFKAACLRFLGLPYLWGGDDPLKGFDCSGLIQELLAMIGMDPPGDQSAQSLYDYFRESSRGYLGIQKITGTLVFWGESQVKITHVAMMLEPDCVIEAGSGGSKTTSLEAASQQNAFIRLRKYNPKRSPFVAVITPKGLPWIS